MSDDSMSLEDCAMAMWRVQNFLHGELSEDEADEIRQHLMACEACLDFYDSETLISAMVRRCCEHETASSELRARVTCLHVKLGDIAD